MVQPQRVQALNGLPVNPNGRYVLYWMQQSQRSRFNFALEYAIERANELNLPVVVCFGLMDDYPGSNLRHHTFMLQGLCELPAALAKRHIRFLCKRGNPPEVALHYGGHAGLIVCDRGYLRHQKAWRETVGRQARCLAVQVESDVVVPVETASEKREFAARTIRPKIAAHLGEFLRPLRHGTAKKSSLRMKLTDDVDLRDPTALAAKLTLDRSVGVSTRLSGGEAAAHRMLKRFLQHRLARYATARAEPNIAGTSMMAAYLHFGHISAIEIALAVKHQDGVPPVDREAYLEELIVRRELAMNFVQFTSNYDQYDCLPAWAKTTLAEHRNDRRPHRYSLEQLELGDTDDQYWNAAQHEMTSSGFMHNQLRMYWGKKILEWSHTPQRAYEITLHLNNKYFLCGRDPNSFANVGWVFGLHDRPWGPERPIFGKVRYMNAAGLKRKFDMPAYVRMVNERAWEKW